MRTNDETLAKRPRKGERRWAVTPLREFAYRDGPWKLVWRLSQRNLAQSRGKPTVPELYNLDTDVAEQADLSGKHPDIVERMTKGLRTLIDRGTSRDGQQAANDTLVRFKTTQEQRWAPALPDRE